MKRIGIGGVCIKGGPGSGNFGHSGRPGERGGSSSEGGGGGRDSGWTPRDSSTEIIKDLKDYGVTVTFRNTSEKRAIDIGNTVGIEVDNLSSRFDFGKTRISFDDSLRTSLVIERQAGYANYVVGIKGRLLDGPLKLGDNVVDESVSGVVREALGGELLSSLSHKLKDSWSVSYSDRGRDWWTRNVSQEADNDISAFEQAFSAFTHSDYDGGLPKDVEQFIGKLVTDPKKR